MEGVFAHRCTVEPLDILKANALQLLAGAKKKTLDPLGGWRTKRDVRLGNRTKRKMYIYMYMFCDMILFMHVIGTHTHIYIYKYVQCIYT